MKKYLFFLNFCISLATFAQIKVRVYDAQDEFRLTGANIYDDTKQFLGQTDEVGELDINDSIHFIDII